MPEGRQSIRKRKGASSRDASHTDQCADANDSTVKEPANHINKGVVDILNNEESSSNRTTDDRPCLNEKERRQQNGSLQTDQQEEKEGHSRMWSGVWRKSELQMPFGVDVRVDVMLCTLAAVSFITRLWRLEEPNKVVFDEVHAGKFISFYMRRMFFLDVQPPLGKLLLAFVAYMCNFNGKFLFNEIGEDYSGQGVPVFHLRLIPAIFGSLLVPLVYQVCVEFGLSHWTAAGAAFLTLLDNALLTQSRFIMLDSIFLAFSLAGVLAYLKMTNCTHKPFSLPWWKWMIICGLCLGCAVSTEYVGVMSVVFVTILAFVELWKMLPDQTMTLRTLLHHATARFIAVFTLPLLVYLLSFYVRFALLINSGPHDSLVSDEIKRTLIGSKLPVDQTLYKDYFEVAYGTQIMLHQSLSASDDFERCWLHSHAHIYPVSYKDGRNSSQQQQVTCYNFKDLNNWWIVKKPKRDLLKLGNPPELVKSGDVIELVHGTTKRQLNSHNVAGPITKTAQEVSGFTNNSLEGFFRWRVELIGADPGTVWRASKHSVQLVHVQSDSVLAVSGERLPEWGFHQMEVVASKRGRHKQTVWNIAEHQNAVASTADPRAVSQQQLRSSLYRNASQLVTVSFWTKLWHIQVAMVQAMNKLSGDHDYSTGPAEWPLLSRGIAYWMSNVTNAQVYFIGNPLVWWPASASVLLFLGWWLLEALVRRRQFPDIYPGVRHDLATSRALFLGWSLHYVPYFFVHGMLFLHHYLPSLLFKIMLFSATIEQFFKLLKKRWMKVAAVAAITLYLANVFTTFAFFAPISYGHVALSNAAISDRQWRANWEMLVHVALSPYLRQQLLFEQQQKLLKQQELKEEQIKKHLEQQQKLQQRQEEQKKLQVEQEEQKLQRQQEKVQAQQEQQKAKQEGQKHDKL